MESTPRHSHIFQFEEKSIHIFLNDKVIVDGQATYETGNECVCTIGSYLLKDLRNNTTTTNY